MNNTSTDTNTTATDQLRNCQLPKWSMDAAQTLRREPHTMKKSQRQKSKIEQSTACIPRVARPLIMASDILLASCMHACDAHIEHLVVVLL
jgi:hypothetical protein